MKFSDKGLNSLIWNGNEHMISLLRQDQLPKFDFSLASEDRIRTAHEWLSFWQTNNRESKCASLSDFYSIFKYLLATDELAPKYVALANVLTDALDYHIVTSTAVQSGRPSKLADYYGLNQQEIRTFEMPKQNSFIITGNNCLQEQKEYLQCLLNTNDSPEEIEEVFQEFSGKTEIKIVNHKNSGLVSSCYIGVIADSFQIQFIEPGSSRGKAIGVRI